MKPATVGAFQIENAKVDDEEFPLVEKGRSRVVAPPKLAAPRLNGTIHYLMTTSLHYLLIPVMTYIIFMSVVLYVLVLIEPEWPIQASCYAMGYAMAWMIADLLVSQWGIVVRGQLNDIAMPLLRYSALLGAFTGVLDYLWYNNLGPLLFEHGWDSLGDLLTRVVAAATLDSVFWFAVDLMTHFTEQWYFVNWQSALLDVERLLFDVLWEKVAGFPLLLSVWAVFADIEGWWVRPIIVMAWALIADLCKADFNSQQSIQGGDVLLSHCIDDPVAVISEGGQRTVVMEIDDERYVQADLKTVELDQAVAEAAVHIPLLGLEAGPKRVLLLGDGNGLYAEQVLKHAGISRLLVLEPRPLTSDFVRTNGLGRATVWRGRGTLGGDSRAELRNITLPLAECLSRVVEAEGPFDFVLLSPMLSSAEVQAAVPAVTASVLPGGIVALRSERSIRHGLPPHVTDLLKGMSWRRSLNGTGMVSSTNRQGSVWFLAGRGSDDAPSFDSASIASRLPDGLTSLLDEDDVTSALCQPQWLEEAFGGIVKSRCSFQSYIKESGTKPESPWEDPSLHLTVGAMLCNVQTPFQRVQIVETQAHGVGLFTDNAMQSSAADEFIYHEGLVHVPCVMHGSVRRVLIGGAGEGATLRELLRYEAVEEIITVDIDEMAVKCYQKHLFQWHRNLWKHSKVKLIINDINEVLKEYHGYFDLLILDLTDPTPTGPSAHLFSKEFYERCRQCLRPGGLMAMQSGECTPTRTVPAICRATLGEVFASCGYYCLDIPSFLYPWLVIIAATDVLECVPEDLNARASAIQQHGSPSEPGPLRFYSAATHRALFRSYRHRTLRRAIERPAPVVREGYLQLVGNSGLVENDRVWEGQEALGTAETVAKFQADRVISSQAGDSGTQVAIDLRQHVDVRHLRLVYQFFKRKGVTPCLGDHSFPDFLEDVIDCGRLVVAVASSTEKVQDAFGVEALVLASSVFVTSGSAAPKRPGAAPSLLAQLIVPEIEVELRRVSTSLVDNAEANFLLPPAAELGDFSEVIRRRCLTNTNISHSVALHICELLRPDAAPCLDAGHEPLLSLVCGGAGAERGMRDPRKLAAPWLFPPDSRIGLASPGILLVDASYVPEVNGAKFLTRFHVKLLLVAAWWNALEEPQMFLYPGFASALSQLDSYPRGHHFRLLPADGGAPGDRASRPFCAPYQLWTQFHERQGRALSLAD